MSQDSELSIGMLSSTPISIPSAVCLLPMRIGMPRKAACCLALASSLKSGQLPVEVSVKVYSRTVSCEEIEDLSQDGLVHHDFVNKRCQAKVAADVLLEYRFLVTHKQFAQKSVNLHDLGFGSLMRQDEPHAPNGTNGTFFRPAQLVSQRREVDVQRSCVVEETLAPNILDDIVSPTHNPLIPQQIEQQTILRFRECHRLARLQDLMRGRIDQEVGVVDDFQHLNYNLPG